MGALEAKVEHCMGVIISLISLLASAILCFLISRVGLTRRMAWFAAGAAALAALTVMLDAPDVSPPDPWLAIGAVPLALPSALPMSERVFAIALLAGGAVGFVFLATSTPQSAEGFGALFGWLLLALAAAFLSLSVPPLSFLTPLSWGITVVATHGALVTGGGEFAAERLPPHLIAGGIAVVIVSGLVAALAALPADATPAVGIVFLALVGALALAGAPPFAGARSDFTTAPAMIGALIAGLILPTVGLGFVARVIPQIPPLTGLSSQLLATVGAFGAFGAAIGALGAGTGRQLLAWHGALQAGVVACAAAINEPLAGLAVAALLLALQLHAVAGGLVVATMIRYQENDHLDGSIARVRLPGIGLIWIITTATATGAPLAWSFWGWRWLIEALAAQQVWVIGPLIGAAVLGLASGVPLLLRCWHGRASARRFWPEEVLAAVIVLPLVLAGLAPWLAWPLWLSWSPFAPPSLPAEPIAWPLVLLVVALGLIGWQAARLPNPYQPGRDREETDVTPAWSGMSDVLGSLTEPANARLALRLIARSLDRASSSLHTAMIIFEQRFYLFGVIIALLAILVLMAQ